MKNLEKVCTAIHIFNGVGALMGGYAAISDPVNPLGVPASVLVNAPFTDFFIPGLFLFCVLGIGNLFAAVSFFTKMKLRAYVSGFFASALVIWIVVQCVMLMFVDFLHVAYFFIGAAQGILALVLLLQDGRG